MKHELQHLLAEALSVLVEEGALRDFDPIRIQVERTREKAYGDFASNVALALAKSAGQSPRQLAEQIVARLPSSGMVVKTEVAGPGFINFFIRESALLDVIGQIFDAGDAFGHSDIGRGRSLHLEFVSANPTGPLHVGHGRGAAYGAALGKVLQATGFHVHREYYVNDAGRQMDILAASTWLRYLELCGEAIAFPARGYKGAYVLDIARALHAEHGATLHRPAAALEPAIRNLSTDEEAAIDAIVACAKAALGEEAYRRVFETALRSTLDDIREDLAEFGVEYDTWYSERDLISRGAVDQALEMLSRAGYVYEASGARWFRASAFADEKDRVVVRENGQITYFASDIAYHIEKLHRGYDHIIDIWGADHHGYVPRIKAVLEAAGLESQRLEVLLVQFATLYRGGEKAQMSTRSGEFVTLRQLRSEVGNDAARFFYVMRKCEQHMDFDIDLAKSQSNDNPVYYIQYAHARICSVMRQLAEKGMTWDLSRGLESLHELNELHEQNLIRALSRYPEVIEISAVNHEPHHIAHYLRELANELHVYYNAHQFLVEKPELRNARLALINATRQVLHNGLGLLGVTAPERM